MVLEQAAVPVDGRPRNPFGAGRLLRIAPGLAAQFQRTVPVSHVTAEGVRCCAGVVPVAVGEIAECPGGCGRFFLRTETSVRVARWNEEDG